jgi:hypothetical protein
MGVNPLNGVGSRDLIQGDLCRGQGFENEAAAEDINEGTI